MMMMRAIWEKFESNWWASWCKLGSLVIDPLTLQLMKERQRKFGPVLCFCSQPALNKKNSCGASICLWPAGGGGACALSCLCKICKKLRFWGTKVVVVVVDLLVRKTIWWQSSNCCRIKNLCGFLASVCLSVFLSWAKLGIVFSRRRGGGGTTIPEKL